MRQERDCDRQVTEVLFPIIRRALGEHSIDFSIITADIDLRELQDNITEFADGRLTRTDFFRPSEVIVQWNTHTGRIDAAIQGG